MDQKTEAFTRSLRRAATSPEVLHRNNELMVMIPQNTELTAENRKLYALLLKETQVQYLQHLEEHGIEPSGRHLYKVPTAKLLAHLKLKAEKDNFTSEYQRLKNSLTKLKRIEVDWISIESGSAGGWGLCNLIAQVNETRSTTSFVYWALPPEILDRLVSINYYTKISLIELMKLKSHAAIVLYEILSRYKTFVGGRTATHTTDWWTIALRKRANSERGWRQFKHESVEPAVAEINDLTDLCVEGPIEVRKAGPRSPVEGVFFRVQPKVKELAESQPPEAPISVETSLLAAKSNVTLNSIKTILNEFPIKGEIITQAALLKMENRSIDKPGPYFLKTAREIAARDPSSTVPAAALAKKPSETITEPELTDEQKSINLDKQRMLDLPHEKLVALVQRALDKLEPGAVTPKLLQNWEAFKTRSRALPPILVAPTLKIFRGDLMSNVCEEDV
jgi:hypothetical protein